jgi:hypothetical protein
MNGIPQKIPTEEFRFKVAGQTISWTAGWIRVRV